MATARDNLARKQIYIPALQSEAVVLRVAAYCRVSTDSEDQLNSFAAQQSYYNDYIRKHDNWQLAEIYADEGITGTSAAKRDDFQRMLSDCRKGRIDKILVKSISRFARNTKECLEYIRELKALGISVFFEEHNIDTRMVTSEMLTAVLASCAQAESESISKNMVWSVQRRMQKGTFNTCRAGTGFLLSKDGLAIRPEAVPVIQSIYMDYVSGINSREISNRLTAEKALGRVWNRKLVDYILTNERYAGNAMLQKKYRTDTFPRVKKPNRGERPMYYVEDSNPAMIDQELFDQAAELRKSRRRNTTKGQARPFAKKLYCQCCGSLLRSKKTNGTWYWVCRTHEESAEKCPLPPIPEDEIIRAFLRLYYNLKNHQEILTFLLQQERKIRTRQMLWGADIVEINKRISDIISQSHKLTAMQKSGNVDPDIFIAKSNQLAEQLRKAKQQKETLQTQEDNDLIESTSQMLEAISAGPDVLEAFNAELFCELIERITIQSNTKIRFRLKNGLELPESIERTVR